jgi:N-acetylneuraminic acid mutarotase
LLVVASIGFVLTILGCSNTNSSSTNVQTHSISGSLSTADSTGFTGRANPGSGIINGKIYVVDGMGASASVLNTLEVFDPVTNSWSTPQTAGKNIPRAALTAAVVNNKLYVIGGCQLNGTNYIPLSSVEVFDPASNSWSTLSTTGKFTLRWALSSCVVNNKIYVLGGYDGVSQLGTLEVFDPSTNSWSTPQTNGSMTPRTFPGVAVVDGKIYVMGGGTVQGNALNTFEAFDPSTNSWSTPKTDGAMTARYGLASAVVNGIIYAIDGQVGPNYLNSIEAFDPSINTWRVVPVVQSLIPRTGPAANVIGNKIYINAGYNGTLDEEVLMNEVFTQSQ